MNHKRSIKQWHDCGDKPNIPENGQDVKCHGAYCAAVCPIGWRSRGRWRVKCQADNTWSHSKFSPCITCPDMSEELKGTNAVVQNIFQKNLPVTQIFCGDSSNQLQIKDRLFKKGGHKRNIKCECKNGQNGDPAWKKSCNWSFKGEQWSVQDVSSVTCRGKGYTPPGPITPRPPTTWKIGRNEKKFGDVTIYPNYEISIDLKLRENKNTWWSNVLGFRVDGVIADDGKGFFPQGSRIPAVFLYKESTRILVCSAVNGDGNNCWSSSEEMPVDTWFNLKIKQEAIGSKYVYQIFVDGEQVQSIVNNDPMTFENVNGLIGNAYEPERDFLIPDGRYRNFEFDSPQFGPTPATIRDAINRNDVIHSGVTVHPIYSVSIDLNLEQNPHKVWSNVLGFRQDGVIADDGKGFFPQGSRIPAVFLYAKTTKLLVCSAMNDNGNVCWGSKEEMPTDTWFNLKIMQVWNEDIWSPRYTYKIFIDDVEMRSIENKSPVTFENVDGILGNAYEPERDFLTAVGRYRNFEFESQRTPHPEPWMMDQIKPNDVVFDGVTVNPEYEVSIDLNLQKNTNDWWSNIISFIVEGINPKNFPEGGRIPAVYLYKNSNKMLVCSALNGNGNVCWTSQEMPIDTWFNLKIKQSLINSEYIYQIFIDDELKREIVNTEPRTFENVQGITANSFQPFWDFHRAAGKYKNFKFNSQ